MTRTTKEQRAALKKIWLRGENNPAPTYRAFRKRVQPIICGDGAICLPWAGMWLAIETDGYTHS